MRRADPVFEVGQVIWGGVVGPWPPEVHHSSSHGSSTAGPIAAGPITADPMGPMAAGPMAAGPAVCQGGAAPGSGALCRPALPPEQEMSGTGHLDTPGLTAPSAPLEPTVGPGSWGTSLTCPGAGARPPARCGGSSAGDDPLGGSAARCPLDTAAWRPRGWQTFVSQRVWDPRAAPPWSGCAGGSSAAPPPSPWGRHLASAQRLGFLRVLTVPRAWHRPGLRAGPPPS